MGRKPTEQLLIEKIHEQDIENKKLNDENKELKNQIEILESEIEELMMTT